MASVKFSYRSELYAINWISAGNLTLSIVCSEPVNLDIINHLTPYYLFHPQRTFRNEMRYDLNDKCTEKLGPRLYSCFLRLLLCHLGWLWGAVRCFEAVLRSNLSWFLISNESDTCFCENLKGWRDGSKRSLDGSMLTGDWSCPLKRDHYVSVQHELTSAHIRHWKGLSTIVIIRHANLRLCEESSKIQDLNDRNLKCLFEHFICLVFWTYALYMDIDKRP